MRDLVSLNFFLDDDAQKYLDSLARSFPKEMQRTVQGVGFQMRRVLQKYMRKESVPGKKWKQLSRLQTQIRAMQGRTSYSLKQALLKDKDFRFKGKTTPGKALKKLVPPMRYVMEKSGYGVLIGGVHPGVDKYVRAVQLGGILRGNSNMPTSGGPQTITPKMRRLFYAAGIFFKKGKTTINQPQRTLIRPVFEAHQNHIYRYVMLSVKNYVEKTGLRRDTIAAQAGFNTSFT